MKILLVCAGGCSTSILMKKMNSYWKEKNVELLIKAVGMGDYLDVVDDYDIILVGPQINYRLDDIKEDTNKPCSVIPSVDYAIANCANIMALAERLYEEIA